jgi:hypothetical protein
VLQLGYISHLFSTKTESVNAACAVGSRTSPQAYQRERKGDGGEKHTKKDET